MLPAFNWGKKNEGRGKRKKKKKAALSRGGLAGQQPRSLTDARIGREEKQSGGVEGEKNKRCRNAISEFS